MSKDFAFTALNELKDSFELTTSEKSQLKHFNAIIIRNFILSYYTIWETYVKQRIYDIYVDHENLLYDEQFIGKYFNKIIKKNHLKKNFLNNLNDTKVKKEILCDSNNLTWKEFEGFLNTINFEPSLLKSSIADSENISRVLLELENRSVFPVFKEDNKENDRVMKKVVGYIQYVVDVRNQISHTYDRNIEDRLTRKKMLMMINFLKCLIIELENYFEYQLLEKYNASSAIEPLLKDSRVIKGCSINSNDYGILEFFVNTAVEIDFRKEYLLKNSSNKLARVKIIEIRVDNIRVRKLYPNKLNSIKIQTVMKIKRDKQYEILDGLSKVAENIDIVRVNL